MNDSKDKEASSNIRDSIGSLAKGEWNVKKKSFVEEGAIKQKEGRRMIWCLSIRTKIVVHLFMKEGLGEVIGKLVHFSNNKDHFRSV